MVVDMTGIKGRYQLAFEVLLKDLPRPDPAAMDTGSERDAAILQRFNDGLRKLGLRLERRRGPGFLRPPDTARRLAGGQCTRNRDPDGG